MWVRQCDIDASDDDRPPIPAVIASNEEFIPPPQSREQKEYLTRFSIMVDEVSRHHGIPRRDYLRSSRGMAAALIALNQVHGQAYDVDPIEAVDPLAFEEKWPKDQFIFDVQTHHVDVSRRWYDETETGQRTKSFFERLRPEAKTPESSSLH
jgi:hypothetical protein